MRIGRAAGRSLWRQHHDADGTPKHVFASLAAAQRARIPNVEAYICGMCRQWHLGNPPKSGRR